jgi:hypothetical protein
MKRALTDGNVKDLKKTMTSEESEKKEKEKRNRTWNSDESEIKEMND